MKKRLVPSQNHPNKKQYNWLLYDIIDKYLIEYASTYKGVMLDLGCGEKPFEAFFSQYVDTYIGVDWSDTQHNLKADIVSDLNKKIDLEDRYADTIISLNVLEHLYNPQKFLDETYRLLKHEGTLILHIPFQWWIHEAPHDYFRYTPYGLKYLLNKSGYKDIHIQPASGFFTTILMKINYFSLRAIKGSEFRQFITRNLLRPFWWINQKIAPVLDNMHRGWSLETQSFFVVAKKQPISMQKGEISLIGSLTSYGQRINVVHLAIESLLNQTKQLDKIILWLAEDEFSLTSIPKELQRMSEEGFVEIKFCKDIRSYKKLIPTLKIYKNDVIITFDDDVLYDKTLVESLHNEYLKYPKSVHCGRGHKILFDKEFNPCPYTQWAHCSDSSIESTNIFPTGAGGILYPPNCFSDEVMDEELFMKLAPKADDVWFKAMTLKKNVRCKILPQRNKEYTDVINIAGTQEDSLYSQNKFGADNDQYIQNVFKYFDLHKKLDKGL
jgi:SAM-dependent methyltransferase